MSPAVPGGRTPLRVGQRLFLALLPSLFAVALVLALSYYGQLDRQAPHQLVWAAAALAALSLFVTWRNTQYLRTRIERLAERTSGGASGTVPGGVSGAVDELDRIEQTVDQLGSALSVSEAERARVAAATAARLVEQATLLAAVSEAALQQVDEARLPLQILLDAQFGELSPNQEELLADAREAAGRASEALRRLRALADVDRGALEVRREWVSVDEVARAVLPAIEAQARTRGGRVRTTLEPALPRGVGDRTRLAAALALVLGEAATTLADGGELEITTGSEPAAVWITLAPIPDTPDVLLARRLLEAQGATVVATTPTPTRRALQIRLARG